METFPQNIREVRQRDAGVMNRFDIDLSIVLTDQEYAIAGNMFYIWNAPAGTYIDIRINEKREPAIPYVEQTGQETPFDKLYITTPAGQAGTVTLLYGTEAPELVRMIDNRSAQSTGLDSIRDELRGDTVHENYTGVTVGVAAGLVLAANADRKACIVQALSTNTGRVFLGFTNAVTAGGAPGTWFAELQPGQPFAVDDYRGPLYAIATVAGQVVGVGEW